MTKVDADTKNNEAQESVEERTESNGADLEKGMDETISSASSLDPEQLKDGNVQNGTTTSTSVATRSSFQKFMESGWTRAGAILAVVGIITGIFIWATDGEFCDFGLGGNDSDNDEGGSSGYSGGYNGELGN